MFAQQLIANGLIAGAIYALVASGFSLIFSTNRFMHLAHGASITVGAYVLYYCYTLLGLPFWLSCILTLAFTTFFGFAMYRLVYLPLQKKNASNIILLIVGLALLTFFQNLVQMIFGAQVRNLGLLQVSAGKNVLGASVTPLQMIIIAVSLFLFFALHYFMKKSTLGRDMRAVADNKNLASIVGIHQQRIADYSFLIGSFLAGLAGILIALEQNLHPLMGTTLIIKGFAAAIIGGIGSVPGAVLGSFLLGLSENLGTWFIASSYKDAIAYGLLFVFLLLRPSGILGIARGMKK